MRKIFWMTAILVSSCMIASAQDPYNDNPPPQQQQNTDDQYYQDNSNDNDYQDDNGGMSYQTFYDQLSPYGTWIDYPGRGYCWVPQVDANFSPYETSGHWVFTDAGWTWVSDYDWGWAAFHYGRWFFDAGYGGWLWAPGIDWAPAWVTWGEYGGYYCWAPLGWGEPLYGSIWADRHWYFVDRGHIGDDHVVNHVVPRERVDREVGVGARINIINHSNTYHSAVFNAGPKREDVEKVMGHSIAPVRINNDSKPGGTRVNGNQVNIYRPVMSKNTAVQQKAIPSKLTRPDDIHPANNNNNANRSNPQPFRNTPANNETPYRSNPTPPRQSTPRQDNQYNSQQSQPARSEPQQQRPSGGFIPSERPAAQPSFHPAPAPSFHAPAGGSGGSFHGGGGGRHR